MKKFKLTLAPDSVQNTITKAFHPLSDRSYIEWLAEGNTPDPAETEDEEKNRLLLSLRDERNRLLRESDAMMLEDWPRGGATDKIKAYRQLLRDMPDSHTTIEKIKKPLWPTLK